MAFDGISDFRSDTVTRPTPAMYEAMAGAPLGDDVFGDDPTVNELQARAAERFGKEAALFVPSGTMGNQIAVRVHTQLGDELIVEEGCHTFLYEQGGVAQISGVQARTLRGIKGQLDLNEVQRCIRADDEHFPRTSLLILENTHNSSGGSVLGLDYLTAAADLCRSHQLSLHLDGARIFNAIAASGIEAREWGQRVDSLTFCLSKGLAAPVGSILVGSETFIAQARRVRKVLGGGLRQVGILAAAGLVALDEMTERLSEDHARARALYEALESIEGVSVDGPATNMLYADVGTASAADLCSRMYSDGVHVLPTAPHVMRFVTHKDIVDADVARAAGALASALSDN